MLISEQYRLLNKQKHKSSNNFGTKGSQFAGYVARIAEKLATTDVLDYGCGKHTMAMSLPFKIREYDPALEGYDSIPEPADIVSCTDVLEHIEPECLENVLDDLKRVTRRMGLFTIHTGPALKHLPDGRNAHLTQKPMVWWLPKIVERFEVIQVQNSEEGNGFLVIVKAKND